MAKKTAQVLVMKNGIRIPLLYETGQFYVCEKQRFFKWNPNILGVEKVKIPQPVTEETTKEEAPKKKAKAGAKKKKAEAAAEKPAKGEGGE